MKLFLILQIIFVSKTLTVETVPSHVGGLSIFSILHDAKPTCVCRCVQAMWLEKNVFSDTKVKAKTTG